MLLKLSTAVLVCGVMVWAEGPQLLPNPYQPPIKGWEKMPDRGLEDWAWRPGATKMPAARSFGFATGMAMDRKGNMWIFDRCGENTCVGSKLDPILEFDPAGKFLKSFGAGMFVWPFSLYIDRNDNIWVTDNEGQDGKGHTVTEFTPEGKVLMTLGKPGVAGDGPDTFNRPSGVVVAPDGDIFVSDGKGGDSNARIVKFSKDGKFIKSWGKKGSGPGEFGELHGIAMDSRGRLFVADRGNNRIEIFDREGNFLDQWAQFSRPTAVVIDKNDTIYVPDNQSTATTHPGWPQGIYIGNAKDGKVTGFIPIPDLDRHEERGTENVVVDAQGTLYVVDFDLGRINKFVKK
jgi:DNA-binding beta-propeller fold protein YncE